MQVFSNCVSIFTIAHEFSRPLSSGFFGKRDVFLEKHLKVFKNTKRGYFLLECFSNVSFLLMQSANVQNLSFFEKQWRFLRIKPWKISGALFGVFHRDCVSDFHIASKFSKQSNIWFVWRNRCFLWKDPFFSLESVNVAFLSQLAFQKK